MLYRLSYGGIYETPAPSVERHELWRDIQEKQTKQKCWRRPIFPGRFQPSIFGAGELNFCVRNGNRWTLTVKITNYSAFACQRTYRSFWIPIGNPGVGIDLFSRAASSQVSSAQMSLTSVFGMGTGGPSSLKIPTMVHLQGFNPVMQSHTHMIKSQLLQQHTPSFCTHWCTFRDSNPGPTD